MDDWGLLQQYVRDASRDAMEQLVRRHQDMVYAAACREVGNRHLAADITQAVFLVLIRRASRIGPDVVLPGWLFKVMRFAAADARKSQARRERHERRAAAMKMETSSGTDLQGDPRLLLLLNDAIASLPRIYRDAVVMKYLQGKSHVEVASALRINENAARQRLFRAIGRLRAQLNSKALAAAGVGAVEATLAATSARAAPSEVTSAIHSAMFSAQARSDVAALATRTLRSMYMWNIKLAVTICGLVLFPLVMGIMLHSVMAQQVNSLPVALAPASQPGAVISKHGPAKTPRDTIKQAFDAACAGDASGFLSCFDQTDDADQKTLEILVHVLSAAKELRDSVADKFGATVADNLFSATGVGVIGTDIGGSDEAIISDSQATVDVHTGPGKILLVKIGDVWKISPTVLVNLNRAGVEVQDRLAPEMRSLARDVRAGKYTTIEDFRSASADRLKVEPGN